MASAYQQSTLSTFKYLVSCTDGKVSVRIIYFIYFSTGVQSNSSVFLFFRPLVVNTTFSTIKILVENVVLTTKGLQKRNTQLLDGTTVEIQVQ